MEQARETGTADNSWKVVRLLVPFFKLYGGSLTVGFIALLSVDFCQLWIPRIIKRAVDELQFSTATQGGLVKHGLTVVLLALLIAICRFGWRYFVLGFSRLVERDLRDWLFSHLLSLDRIFFQRRTTGEIMALSSNDLSAIQMATGMGLIAFIDAVVMTVAVLGFMAYINPQLTLIAVLPMPILAVLTRFLTARLHRRFKKVQEQFSTLTEFARATISSIRLYKAYTQEKSQTYRFDQLGRAYISDNLQLATIQGTLWPASGLVANLSMLLVLFFGGRLCVMGRITVGDFVAFITYLLMLTWPMMAFGWVANLFQRGVTSLGRINKVLQEESALADPAGLEKAAMAIKNSLTLRDLSFTYAGQEIPALSSVSLEIRPGVLGVIGRTGSGKSTLCNLLARLYPVKDDVFLVDGKDVNRLPLSSVRANISYVPQDTILFSDTISANISLGRPDATPAEIEIAARAASIHGEIMAMADGYQSRIGEQGVKLSGGQRQRIALARALLLDRPVLIIDDGLSAVDTQTEHDIVQSLASYLHDRICIIVSHRVAPLVDADTILVMDRGRVTARGTHEELLAKNPFYATIYHNQTAEAF